MWVKVREAFRFRDRLAIASLDSYFFTDVGYDDDFMMQLIDSSEFNEDLIRSLLSKKYDGVEDWLILCVQFNAQMFALDVIVSSQDIPLNNPGSLLPRVSPKLITEDA